MSQRRFSAAPKPPAPAIEGTHVRKTCVQPLYFALVNHAVQFVQNRHGQVIVYTTRDEANRICRQKGWPGNIGMGEEKWAIFTRDYAYVIDPSSHNVPKANQLRMYLYPIILLVLVVVSLFVLIKFFNLFEVLAKVLGSLSGLEQSGEAELGQD